MWPLTRELAERFDQSFLDPVVAMERTAINAANGGDCDHDLAAVKACVFGKDIDTPKFALHLAMLPDIVRQAHPEVKEVTSNQTVCTAMATATTHRQMFGEIHELLCLSPTIPITSATLERYFLALKRLLIYLRSAMTEQRLNNCSLVHTHMDSVDDLPLLPLAMDFASANDEHSQYFSSFH